MFMGFFCFFVSFVFSSMCRGDDDDEARIKKLAQRFAAV